MRFMGALTFDRTLRDSVCGGRSINITRYRSNNFQHIFTQITMNCRRRVVKPTVRCYIRLFRSTTTHLQIVCLIQQLAVVQGSRDSVQYGCSAVINNNTNKLVS